MVRKTCSPEQIINKLREAEVLISQRIPIAEASRKIGATEQTYYRWRRKEDRAGQTSEGTGAIFIISGLVPKIKPIFISSTKRKR